MMLTFNRRGLLVVCFVLVLLIVAVPVFAQSIPEPPVVDDGGAGLLLTADETQRLAEDAVNGIVIGAAGSTLVMLVVQLLKFIPPLKTVKAPDLATFVTVTMVLIGTVANGTGYGDVFDSSARFMEQVLPAVITIMTAIPLSGFLFSKVRNNAVGGWVSYSRTPDAA